MKNDISNIALSLEQQRALKATQAFMRNYWWKIIQSLATPLLNKKSTNPILTANDLREIQAFFEEFPEISIWYDSELVSQRITLTKETAKTLLKLI